MTEQFQISPLTHTVAAIGKFDGVHIGHQKLIQTAAEIAQEEHCCCLAYVICPDTGSILTNDAAKEKSVKTSGAELYYREALTKEYMAMSPETFVRKVLKSKLHCVHAVVGYNFRFGAGRAGDISLLQRLCAQNNIGCTVIGKVSAMDTDGSAHAVSSTRIRELIRTGRAEEASHYLGRYFSISGEVIHGKELGRTINFPTANVFTEKRIILPQEGVYATLAEIDEHKYLSFTNIGTNPTVGDSVQTKIECHIFDFKDDLYGKQIEVSFLEKIRPEVKFTSLTQLREQLLKDKFYTKSKYSNLISKGI